MVGTHRRDTMLNLSGANGGWWQAGTSAVRAVGSRALAGDTAMETKGWDRVVGGWGKGTQL